MAKYYIRTKKNKYDIPVIIDVTSDEVFKNHTSSLPWEEVSLASPGPQKGHYWYDNKSIGLDSADYSEIQSIIKDAEEPNRIAYEEFQKNNVEDYLVAETVEQELIPGPPGASKIAEQVKIADAMADAKAAPASDGVKHGPEWVNEPDELVSTTENLNRYERQLANIKIQTAAFSSASNYTVVPAPDELSHTKITFDPPLSFPNEKDENGDAQVVSEVVVPPADVASGNDVSGYIAYWTTLEGEVQKTVDKMKTDLGL